MSGNGTRERGGFTEAYLTEEGLYEEAHKGQVGGWAKGPGPRMGPGWRGRSLRPALHALALAFAMC